MLVTELRVDRVVASFGRADGPRAADVARLSALGVVPPLAVRPPDRVDRRQVDDVEAQRRELGDHLRDACEPAPRAREQLVPRARAGAIALDVQLEGVAPRRVAPLTAAELARALPPLVDRPVAEQRSSLRELPFEIGLAGRDLAVVLLQPAGVPVDPRLDLEAPAADGVDPERPREAVVAERGERLFAPPGAPFPEAHDGAERLVSVADDRGGDVDTVVDAGLRRPATAVHLRCHVRDRDPFGSHSGNTVNSPACGWHGHSASSSTRPRSREGGWGRRRTPSSTGWRSRERAGGRCSRSTRRTSSGRRMRRRRRSQPGTACWPIRKHGSSHARCVPCGSGSAPGSRTGPRSRGTGRSRTRCASSGSGMRSARRAERRADHRRRPDLRRGRRLRPPGARRAVPPPRRGRRGGAPC